MLTEKLKQLGVEENDIQLVQEAIDKKASELAQEQAQSLVEAKTQELEESAEEYAKYKAEKLLESELQNINEYQEYVVNEFTEKFDAYSKELAESIEDKYKSEFENEAKAIVEHFEDKFDEYSKMIASQITESDNSQGGLKVAMAEELITSFANIFEQYSLDVPEAPSFEDEINEHIESLEESLSDLQDQNSKLQKQVNESVKEKIFNEVSEGLSIKQKETLKLLSENIMMTSQDMYKDRLNTIAESIEDKSDSRDSQPITESDSINEDKSEDIEKEGIIPASKYAKYLG